MTEQQKNKIRTGYNHLWGKVVLLAGNDTAVLPSLIIQLAQKGADIALICHGLSQETMHLMKESVESLGQRFLLIQETDNQGASAEQLIQTVNTRLDQFDVFIDLSVQKKPVEDKIEDSGQPAHLNWQFLQAVLKEITLS